ncbi:hypothetical protein HWV62_4998 [Athelia sp. TMB]|nr:hypothetical protein HWV62_4998 [Athelia sp. TMB]
MSSSFNQSTSYDKSSPSSKYIPDIVCPKQNAEYIPYSEWNMVEPALLSSPSESSQEDSFPPTPPSSRIFDSVHLLPPFHDGAMGSDYDFDNSYHSQHEHQSKAYPFENNNPPNLDLTYLSPRAAIQTIPSQQSYSADYRNADHQTLWQGRYSESDSGMSSSSSPPDRILLGPDGNSRSHRRDSSAQTKKKVIVATEKIRAAASSRRIHPARLYCAICNHDFTTTFARARHMISHSGRRDFPCTKRGCKQSFSTDSGRKRHEKSPTLHKP